MIKIREFSRVITVTRPGRDVLSFPKSDVFIEYRTSSDEAVLVSVQDGSDILRVQSGDFPEVRDLADTLLSYTDSKSLASQLNLIVTREPSASGSTLEIQVAKPWLYIKEFGKEPDPVDGWFYVAMPADGGDNATAEIDNPAKPWETVQAASIAARSFNVANGKRYGVWVKTGTYLENKVSRAGVPIFMEKDAVIYNPSTSDQRMVIGDWDDAAVPAAERIYEVFGFGRIYSRVNRPCFDAEAWNFRYASTAYMEFEEASSGHGWGGPDQRIVVSADTFIGHRIICYGTTGFKHDFYYKEIKLPVQFQSTAGVITLHDPVFNQVAIADFDALITPKDHLGNDLTKMDYYGCAYTAITDSLNVDTSLTTQQDNINTVVSSAAASNEGYRLIDMIINSAGLTSIVRASINIINPVVFVNRANIIAVRSRMGTGSTDRVGSLFDCFTIENIQIRSNVTTQFCAFNLDSPYDGSIYPHHKFRISGFHLSHVPQTLFGVKTGYFRMVQDLPVSVLKKQLAQFEFDNWGDGTLSIVANQNVYTSLVSVGGIGKIRISAADILCGVNGGVPPLKYNIKKSAGAYAGTDSGYPAAAYVEYGSADVGDVTVNVRVTDSGSPAKTTETVALVSISNPLSLP